MLFMLESKARAGVTREQLAQYFNQRMNPSTWDLIRHGVVSNVLFKTGSEPGVFALLSAPSLQEAKALVDRAVERENLFDVQIVPVNQFPHFD